jgi:hypothetical protein
VTLADFKNVLNRPNYKFFFKSMDDDFGWVTLFFWLFTCVDQDSNFFLIFQCCQGRNCRWWCSFTLLQWKGYIMGKI